jgi:hypothetical protein
MAGAPVRILLLLLVTLTMAMAAAPSGAAAAACPVNPGNATAWLGGNGSFNNDANWSNGGPSSACDVSITTPGSDQILMTGGANMKSLTFGGAGSTPQLTISVQGPNTNLNATTTGISIAAGASVTLTCPPAPGECAGGSGGGASLNAGSSTIVNKGTIRVDPNSGVGASLIGNLTNTGTIDIEQDTRHQFGLLLNQGVVEIANGKVFKSATEHCGNTQTVFRNDTGGTLTTAGTGTLDVVNFEQGDGDASGSSPVQMPCGTLKYLGDGDSKILAYGGFDVSGESHANQSLTVTVGGANTNARLADDFTNGGPIVFTCPESGCFGGSGSGVGLNANGHAFVNAGSLTVDPDSGTGAYLDSNNGSVTNTGTMTFEQSAALRGTTVNKGTIAIADTKTLAQQAGSCGDTGPRVINDSGGSINATGTGTLSVINYEQGNGTTSGPAPVQLNCGSLKYTGSGSGTVQVNGTISSTGNLAAGQVLRIVGGGTQVIAPPFGNAGTIELVNGGTLSTGTLTNAGRLTGVGTVNGSVDNAAGTVAPGAGLGTLTVSGNFSQGSGTLEIEVEGTGAGQFDKLAVNGSTTLGGTLTLLPSPAFASGAPLGSSVDFLAYGGSRAGQFAQVTSNPALTCPKQFTAAYDDGAKKVSAVLGDSGAKCGGEGGGGNGGGGNGGAGGNSGGSNPPASNPPSAPVPAQPKPKPLKCKKGFKKVKVKGKTKCAKVKKPKKKGKK